MGRSRDLQQKPWCFSIHCMVSGLRPYVIRLSAESELGFHHLLLDILVDVDSVCDSNIESSRL